MIQGGCPLGNGTGNPGYSIKGEFSNNGFTNQSPTFSHFPSDKIYAIIIFVRFQKIASESFSFHDVWVKSSKLRSFLNDKVFDFGSRKI